MSGDVVDELGREVDEVDAMGVLLHGGDHLVKSRARDGVLLRGMSRMLEM